MFNKLIISLYLVSSSVIYANQEIPKVTYFNFKNHSYLCFNGNYLVHDPDCVTCASKPKVIFKPDWSPDISQENMPMIMQDLSVSKYRKCFFPNLYYWMED